MAEAQTQPEFDAQPVDLGALGDGRLGWDLEGDDDDTGSTVDLDLGDTLTRDAALDAAVRRDAISWGTVWHIPALVMGLLLFGLGLYLVAPTDERPNYVAALGDVDAMIRAESEEMVQRAAETLAEVETAFAAYPPDNEIRALTEQYRGDLRYLGQTLQNPLGLDTEIGRENLDAALGHYEAARGLGRTLDPRSTRWTALALVQMGRDAEALDVLDRMADPSPKARTTILKQLIERQLERRSGTSRAAAAGDETFDPAAGAKTRLLLDRFEQENRREPDAARRTENLAWVTGLEAQFYLDLGDGGRAVDLLNQRIQRLRAAGDEDRPKLVVQLAEAYRLLGDREEATRLFRAAQRRLSPASDLNARVLVGLAEIERMVGGPEAGERAYALFDQAVTQHPTSSLLPDALTGKAEIEAERGEHVAAVANIREVVERLTGEGATARDRRRVNLLDRVAARVDRAVEDDRFDDALDLLSVTEPMHGGAPPLDVRYRTATVHEAIADQRMAHAAELDPLTWAGPGDPPAAARRQAFAEAAAHYERAADGFRGFAKDVTVTDEAAHGEALWRAGAGYDRAERWDQAITVYNDFLKERPQDGRYLQAMHALGAAYLADRQAPAAADLFERLLADHPSSRWAYESLVPLARAYTAMDRPQDAVRTLLRVLENHPAISTDSPIYRAALIDLGRTYYVLGEDDPVLFVRAVERLREAVDRYASTEGAVVPDGPELKYMLADSLRRSVAGIDQRLDRPLPERERLELQAERNSRLVQAERLFGETRNELEARHDAALSDLQKLYRRNAWFNGPDAAYLRGDYAGAIDKYREAAERWQGDPAALVALVQIVNAYCELDNYAAARTANNKALVLLESMDEAAFDRPEMPMQKQHWRDWLRWSTELDLFARRAVAAADTP